MKTVDFIREHNACREGAKWALSISEDMADVWNALVEQKKHDWLMWMLSQPGVFPDSTLRKLACRFARETPLVDGRVVWDLLTDERSRKAVEVAEAYADGKATTDELAAAAYAADAAADSAYSDVYAAYAARAAAWAAWAAASAAWAAHAATYAAVSFSADASRVAVGAARAASESAQIQMIAQLGNPFRKEPSNEDH